jgi:hypothetical protein
MTLKTKKLFDFVPITTLFVSAIFLVVARFSGDILLQKPHVFGLVLLPLAFILFFFKHKLGVLAIGLIVLLGLFGALSFSPAISTITFGKTLADGDNIPLVFFQPIFLLWLTLHLVISGRYYTGIASKRYWQNIDSDEPIRIGDPL